MGFVPVDQRQMLKEQTVETMMKRQALREQEEQRKKALEDLQKKQLKG